MFDSPYSLAVFAFNPITGDARFGLRLRLEPAPSSSPTILLIFLLFLFFSDGRYYIAP